MSRRPASEDEPGTGTPVRDRFKADASAVVDPHVLAGGGMRALLVGRHMGSGNADRRPPVQRPGSTAAQHLPSLVGDTLRWPDGRVTGLDGSRA